MTSSLFLKFLNVTIILLNVLIWIISLWSLFADNSFLGEISQILTLVIIIFDVIAFLFLEKILIFSILKVHGFSFGKVNKGHLNSTFIKSEEMFNANKNFEVKEYQIELEVEMNLRFKNLFSKKLIIESKFINDDKFSYSTNKKLLTYNSYDFENKLISYEYENNGQGNGGFEHTGLAYFEYKKRKITYFNKYPKLSKGEIKLL